MGIFYDKGAQAEAAQLVADWTLQDMADMREQVRLEIWAPSLVARKYKPAVRK